MSEAVAPIQAAAPVEIPVAAPVEAAPVAKGFSPRLFNKWNYDEVHVPDMSLVDLMAINTKSKYKVFLPHTAGRYAVRPFRKVQCPIVERLVCCLMQHGRNSGKKLLAMRVVEEAFDIIHLLTEQNPIQVLVEAICNASPCEDSTRVGTGGNAKRQAVDVSPMRRVNQALYLMTMGCRTAAFRNSKTLAECLADELVNASKKNTASFAMKKKEDMERVAKSNR
ncbi:40S ribosomal protein S5, putative [Entamoeba invadens IP1]|uniref:Small ribosomal subunit protein uS7 n=2 Tax=Entamoeba invadens TaxID=33085 RepID=A0A0A1U8Z6_ENTIV|nr:40S ribosomal protein S5, putative [Entamoeba invadens IP1]ELP91375.1 40S ribosomal protein S5, putative [Entamoeba invadens IP1]BAN40439.1 40S ribosomal protein S5, putative [Entamoeba invadens]BAN42002.1 40S ribosomal protein S5, putative [Entamoeba invadens]BAN42176.1 40S ribosomal protein S5, putative [Entamoeba invadens]|eukprot:XP_004258146.1 40S ribosomal protein S5, putative [Entamoeba invadens IP1]